MALLLGSALSFRALKGRAWDVHRIRHHSNGCTTGVEPFQLQAQSFAVIHDSCFLLATESSPITHAIPHNVILKCQSNFYLLGLYDHIRLNITKQFRSFVAADLNLVRIGPIWVITFFVQAAIRHIVLFSDSMYDCLMRETEHCTNAIARHKANTIDRRDVNASFAVKKSCNVSSI